MNICKSIFKLSAAAIAVSLSTSALAADALTTFSSGETIYAEDMNENFEYLEDKIDDSTESYYTANIDCDADEFALADYLSTARFSGQLKVYVSGTCTGPVYIQKDDVYLYDATIEKSADIDTALYIEGRTSIRLYDTTITSGEIRVKRGADVTIYADDGSGLVLPTLSADTDGEYDDNLYVHSSIFKIDSGTVENMSLMARANSSIQIDNDAIVGIYQIDLDNGTYLDSNLETLTVEGEIYMAGNSTFEGYNVNAGWIQVRRGSIFEADDVTTTDRIKVRSNSVFQAEAVNSVEQVSVGYNSSLDADSVTISNDELACYGSSAVSIGTYDDYDTDTYDCD